MARQQFPFYKSFDDVAEDLTDIQLAIYIRTLLDVQFLRVKIDDVDFTDKTLSIVWKSQKHSISKSINGFLDGQKRETIKEPFLGVYDSSRTPAEGIQQGIKTPKAECKEECKEEYTMLENEFQDCWDFYTLGFFKKQGRNGGVKKKAFNKFISLRKKYSIEEIKALIKSETKKSIGHRDLERVLTIDNIKQFKEDGDLLEPKKEMPRKREEFLI